MCETNHFMILFFHDLWPSVYGLCLACVCVFLGTCGQSVCIVVTLHSMSALFTLRDAFSRTDQFSVMIPAGVWVEFYTCYIDVKP